MLLPESCVSIRRNRKKRSSTSAYAKLIEAPATGTFTLPATGTFFLQAQAAVTTPVISVVINGARSIYFPIGSAGSYAAVGRLESGTTIELQSGFNLCIDSGLGQYKIIGTA